MKAEAARWVAGVCLRHDSALSHYRAAGPDEQEALLWVAMGHRVYVPFVDALKAEDLDGTLSAGRRRQFGRLSRHADDLLEEHQRLARHIAHGDLGVTIVKGFSLQDRYGEGRRRQAGDIDVITHSVGDFWHFSRFMQNRGYRIGSLVLRGEDDQGPTMTGCTLHRDSTDDERLPIRVDVHGGALPLHWCSALPWTVLERLEPHLRAILVLVAECLERPRILIRDVLDAQVLEPTDEESVPLERILPLVRAHGLHFEGRRIALAWERVLPDRPVPRFLTRLGQGARGARGTRRLPRWVRLALTHSLPMARRDPAPLRLRAWRALTAVQADIVNGLSRNSRLRAHVPRPASTRGWAKNGRFTVFVPLDDLARPGFDWLSGEDAEAVLTPLGAFAPAPFGRLTDEDREACAALAATR